LSSLPESLGLLSNLKTLYLVDNPQLTVLPDSLKNLQNLESVYIPDREALQNIPAHWEQLFE
jgi:Leucine-rich repeat (LRR) protein